MKNRFSHNNNIKPPVGGALLECTLSYDHFGNEDILKMAQAIIGKEFCLQKGFAFSVVGKNRLEELIVPEPKKIQDLVNQLENIEWCSTLINFKGKLFDIDSNLRIAFEKSEKVIQLKVKEDFIWAYTEDIDFAKFDRLKVYAEVCSSVCSVRRPLYARMATEATFPDEFTAEKLHRNNSDEKFDDKFFSEVRLRELYNWYINVYAKR